MDMPDGPGALAKAAAIAAGWQAYDDGRSRTEDQAHKEGDLELEIQRLHQSLALLYARVEAQKAQGRGSSDGSGSSVSGSSSSSGNTQPTTSQSPLVAVHPATTPLLAPLSSSTSLQSTPPEEQTPPLASLRSSLSSRSVQSAACTDYDVEFASSDV